MQNLFNNLSAFSGDVLDFQYELEDNYETPTTKTIKEYCARIKTLIAYKPVFTGNLLDKEDFAATHQLITLALTDRLHELEAISKGSNVSDIIDVVRKLHNTLVFYLPENRETELRDTLYQQ